MRKLIDVYYRLLQVVLTLLIAVLIVPVAMQIASRYFDFVPRYIWTEEIARFAFIWIIMVGAAIAVRDGSHFDVDLMPEAKSRAGRLLAKLIVNLSIGFAGIVFLVWGYDFALLGARQRSEIASLPMLSIYIAWPWAGATWILFVGERIAIDCGWIEGPPPRTPPDEAAADPDEPAARAKQATPKTVSHQ
jgi:TRAP-type C4-dicarboxylate transport system permease small subunit